MLSEILLPHLKRHLHLGKIYHCIYYAWDSGRNRVVPCSPFHRIWTRVMLVVSVVYVILQTVGISASSAHTAEKIFTAMLTLMYTACTAIGTEWRADPANLQLMNLIHSGREGQATGEYPASRVDNTVNFVHQYFRWTLE